MRRELFFGDNSPANAKRYLGWVLNLARFGLRGGRSPEKVCGLSAASTANE